jgi:hypothetical protein
MSDRKTTCGCGRPARPGGFLCERCKAVLAAEPPLEVAFEGQHALATTLNQLCDREWDAFDAQHALAAKLNQLSESEWNRFALVGLPARLQ